MTPAMAPETRTRRDGRAVVPSPEVRVVLEELVMPPVAEHVSPRAAAAQRLRERCGGRVGWRWSDDSVGASDTIGAAGLNCVRCRTVAEQADDAAQRVYRESLAVLLRAAERRHDATPRAAETDPVERELTSNI